MRAQWVARWVDRWLGMDIGSAPAAPGSPPKEGEAAVSAALDGDCDARGRYSAVPSVPHGTGVGCGSFFP